MLENKCIRLSAITDGDHTKGKVLAVLVSLSECTYIAGNENYYIIHEVNLYVLLYRVIS